MNALDLLYSAAAHSGSSERGQQRSDSHAERNEHDTMRAYAVEQMRSQQEAEERALSRAAAGLTIGGRAGGQAGALPTPAPIPPSAAVVWGSFERNTGTWCPYPDSAKIEAAYQRGAVDVFLPECFNAHVHFNRMGPHHHQTTPAVGAKPAGYRSVLRGTPGDQALLYFHLDAGLGGMWRLDPPASRGQTQQVEVVAASATATQLWQWCDLTGSDIATAKENNWHTYDAAISADLEAGRAAGRASVQFVVGISTYVVGEFSGAYAVQRNSASGARRMVRRYVSGLAPPPAEQLSETDQAALAGDSCGLCTEPFTEHPQWPVTRTNCGHAFHHTCLGQLLQMDTARRKCPLCRVPLARPGAAAGGSEGTSEGTSERRSAADSGGARQGYDGPGVVSPQYNSYVYLR